MSKNQVGSVTLEHLLLFAGTILVLVGLRNFIQSMDDYYANFSEQPIEINEGGQVYD